MRLIQTTAGTHPSWSQAARTSQEVDWLSAVDRAVSDTPAWVLTVTTGTVVLTLLGMAYLTGRGLWRAAERARRRRQAEQDKAQAEGLEAVEEDSLGLRLIVMALGGMSVSLYGMWGFAREQAGLPEPFAVGFLAMFDTPSAARANWTATRSSAWSPPCPDSSIPPRPWPPPRPAT